MAKKFTTTEAARYLGLSDARARKLITDGLLNAKKVGAFNVIDEKELKRFEKLERSTGRPAKEKAKSYENFHTLSSKSRRARLGRV
jgi:excisionase family DNA binding protein